MDTRHRRSPPSHSLLPNLTDTKPNQTTPNPPTLNPRQVNQQCCEDNPDALTHHELLLPGHLLAKFAKEKLEDCLMALKEGALKMASGTSGADLEVRCALVGGWRCGWGWGLGGDLRGWVEGVGLVSG